MNRYLPVFIEVFSSIIYKYKFEVKSIDDVTILLSKKDFQLEFVMWRETTDIFYNIIISKTKIEKFSISDFIISNMNEQDRNIGVTTYSNDTPFQRNIRALKYFSNVFSRSFSGMLEGDKKWLEDYKNSPYFEEPRIMNFNNTQ